MNEMSSVDVIARIKVVGGSVSSGVDSSQITMNDVSSLDVDDRTISATQFLVLRPHRFKDVVQVSD